MSSILSINRVWKSSDSEFVLHFGFISLLIFFFFYLVSIRTLFILSELADKKVSTVSHHSIADGYEIWLCDLLHLSSNRIKWMVNIGQKKKKNRDGCWGMTVRLRVLHYNIQFDCDTFKAQFMLLGPMWISSFGVFSFSLFFLLPTLNRTYYREMYTSFI